MSKPINKRNCNYCHKFYEGYGREYCSYQCRGFGRIGTPSPLRGVKWDHVSPLKGKKASDETRKRMSEAKLGKKLYNWKGDDAKYGTIHQWVYLRKGKAKQCVECGKTGDRIHWSNVDHKYRRNIEDYVALCARCHKRYDMSHGLTKM